MHLFVIPGTHFHFFASIIRSPWIILGEKKTSKKNKRYNKYLVHLGIDGDFYKKKKRKKMKERTEKEMIKVYINMEKH